MQILCNCRQSKSLVPGKYRKCCPWSLCSEESDACKRVSAICTGYSRCKLNETFCAYRAPYNVLLHFKNVLHYTLEKQYLSDPVLSLMDVNAASQLVVRRYDYFDFWLLLKSVPKQRALFTFSLNIIITGYFQPMERGSSKWGTLASRSIYIIVLVIFMADWQPNLNVGCHVKRVFLQRFSFPKHFWTHTDLEYGLILEPPVSSICPGKQLSILLECLCKTLHVQQ